MGKSVTKHQHHILIVDNDRAICWVLDKAFAEEGYRTAIAANGKEALDMIEKNSFSLVIMDVMMPVMDGLAATRAIRQTLRLDVPIIALTANAIKGDREKCLEAGMDEYLTKPVEMELLYQTLAKLTAVRP